MGEKLLTLFMVLFLAFPLYAQMDKAGSFTVKGQVLDSLTNESVPYATLRIALESTPEKPIKLLACDIDGKFQTPLNNIGTYIIVMQSIGKAPAEKVFTLSDERKVMDLGVLFMQDNNLRLEEVTVTAQKPLVKAEIDRIIYCLEDDPEAQTNNTLEMLRKVPMVTVDGEDKIELKGSSNFKVYMNGKPSNLLSNNPSVVLKSMPASSVKNIEVITEPGVKYDAEGIGGIINIIMVKNTLQGYTGSVSLNTITNGRIFGSGYLSLKAGKFGLSANYNCDRDNTPWNDASSMREDLNNKEEQDGGPYQNGIYLRMYESEKNEIVLKDEYKALYPVIGAGDEEDDGIFLKKHGGNIYLCGSSYAIADIYADGATISSFILTYEEGAFVQQAGTEEPISGSEFYWYSGYWDMAMMMDELDMTEDAAQVRRDHMPRFQSWDEADEMLVRITGENKGYKELLYEETGEIKYLGHVEVLVQLSGF